MKTWQAEIRETAPHKPLFRDLLSYLESGDRTLSSLASQVGEQPWIGCVLRRLVAGLPDPSRWEEPERRMLRAAGLGAPPGRDHDKPWARWLDGLLGQEPPGQETLPMVLDLLAVEPMEICLYLTRLEGTSAGRYLQAMPLHLFWQGIETALPNYLDIRGPLQLLGFLRRHAPDLWLTLLRALIPHRNGVADAVAQMALESQDPEAETRLATFWRQEPSRRLELGDRLDRERPGKYRQEVLSVALQEPVDTTVAVKQCFWLLRRCAQGQREAVKARLPWLAQRKEEVLELAVEVLGRCALPLLEAVLDRCEVASTEPPQRRFEAAADRLMALRLLVALDQTPGESLEPLILSHFQQGLKDALREESPVFHYAQLAGRWDAVRLQDHLWPLLSHNHRETRLAALEALVSLGDDARERAREMLSHRKADARIAAAELAARLGDVQALQERLDKEVSPDVRDEVLKALVGLRGPRTFEQVEPRMAAYSQASPLVPWLDPGRLPALGWIGGEPLSAQQVAYLLHRQSRSREMAPDPEARPLLERLEGTGDFALKLLEAFLGSKQDPKDRWAMALAGLLGDDRVVPLLQRQVQKWADSNRGKMAEYAVEALALLGSDPALMAVDALARQYRSKYTNIGNAARGAMEAAAGRRGLTLEELGDRVVPWLGFEPGQKRVLAGRYELSIGLDYKLQFRDTEKGKTTATTPKALPKPEAAEVKGLAAQLRDVARAQVRRLEAGLVNSQRWPAQRWAELFLTHPLLYPLAARLVWGEYDSVGRLQASFRALEDFSRELTDGHDEPFAGPRVEVGLVHPLELAEGERSAWVTHLHEHDIIAPFSQLERPVERAQALRELWWEGLWGSTLESLTFKGRCDRAGWRHGPLDDHGWSYSYAKEFVGAVAVVCLDNCHVSSDFGPVELRRAGFLRPGSGLFGFDRPDPSADSRLLPLGEVPLVTYSEAMTELRKLAGVWADAEEADDS